MIYPLNSNKSHLSTSSISSLSTQQFDLNNNNNNDNDNNKDNNDDSIDEHLDNNQDHNNKNNHSKPSFSMDYYNYLKKRRVFLIDRLLSRYSELIKLLNEELVSLK
ncbi:unnamed protein product [Trichobilharzia regenti]|nr:unnamed protein product [Trichobilharzia regenti]